MDLYLLNELNKLEAGTSSSGGSAGSMFLPNDASGNTTTWPFITRVNDRQQTDNWNWSSSSPYASFSTYGGYGEGDYEFGVFNAIGKPHTEDNQRTGYDNGGPPELGFIHGGKHGGTFSMYNTKWTNQSYPPFRTTIMWLKNTTSGNLNMNLYGKMSSNWQSGHDGAMIGIGTPNSADKSQVTSVSWVYQGNTSSNTDWSGSITKNSIPAGVTVVCLMMHTLYRYQDSSNVAGWQDLSTFYNIDSLYSQGFRPDYNMYKTSLLARDADWGASGGAWSFSHNNRVRNLYRMCDYNFPET